MPRRLALLLSVALCSCSSWRAVERLEWQRVYARDETRRTPDARQEIISRDTYDEELAAGVHRGYEPPPGFQAPFLHETESIGLRPGEVMEFRVDESDPVELRLSGAGVELFWAPTVKKDEWKGDEGVTRKLSILLVRGGSAGKAVLRLTNGATTKDIPISVSAK